MIHFIGYEKSIASIRVSAQVYRPLGALLATADFIAQMADCCYLEKCRDRLYPEFVAGGLARICLPTGKELVLFESGEDLVRKTPAYYGGTKPRLQAEPNCSPQRADRHFHGQNLYLLELYRNIRFARELPGEPDMFALRRSPPVTLKPSSAYLPG